MCVKEVGCSVNAVYHLPQIQKGKLHGSIDVGLSVMSIKKRARRIDLDTEEHIYHLKVTEMRTVNTVSFQHGGQRMTVHRSLSSSSSGEISRDL